MKQKNVSVKISGLKASCKGVFNIETHTLTVLAGSVVRKDWSPNFKYWQKRNSQIEKYCKKVDANAWELLNEHQELREKESVLTECIEFLIEESKEYMDSKLYWSSPKELVYEMIKDYPMAGVFEETVEEIIEMAPLNVLAPWIDIDDHHLAIANSQAFKNACLYALHPRKIDPYIEINPNWTRSLFFEHTNLLQYLQLHYINYTVKIR